MALEALFSLRLGSLNWQEILTAVREQEELDAKASRDTPTAQRPMRGGFNAGASAGGGFIKR